MEFVDRTTETGRLQKTATNLSRPLPFVHGKQIRYKLFLRQEPMHSLHNHLTPEDVVELSK